MSSGTSEPRQESSSSPEPRRDPASEVIADAGGSSQASAANDLRWLAIAAAGALLFHFAWTVPPGPFEQSPRNRIRSHQAFAALKEKYEQRSFEEEPERESLASSMAFAIERAVELARTRFINTGHQVWLQASDLACRSTRCRFSVCAKEPYLGKGAGPSKAPDPSLQAPLQQALEGFELSYLLAWKLKKIESPGCPRFEVRFLQLPRDSALMKLR